MDYVSQWVDNKFTIEKPMTPGESAVVTYKRKAELEDGSQQLTVRDIRPACGCTAHGAIVDGVLTATFTAPYNVPAGKPIQKTIFIDYLNGHTEALYIYAMAAGEAEEPSA